MKKPKRIPLRSISRKHKLYVWSLGELRLMESFCLVLVQRVIVVLSCS